MRYAYQKIFSQHDNIDLYNPLLKLYRMFYFLNIQYIQDIQEVKNIKQGQIDMVLGDEMDLQALSF